MRYKNRTKIAQTQREEKFFKTIDFQRAICCDFSLHKLIRMNLIQEYVLIAVSKWFASRGGSYAH